MYGSTANFSASKEFDDDKKVARVLPQWDFHFRLVRSRKNDSFAKLYGRPDRLICGGVILCILFSIGKL